jgi:hypothetical protein
MAKRSSTKPAAKHHHAELSAAWADLAESRRELAEVRALLTAKGTRRVKSDAEVHVG